MNWSVGLNWKEPICINENIVCNLLLTMPESYSNVVTTIETMTDGKVIIESVKKKDLLDEESKRRYFDNQQIVKFKKK